MALQLALQLGAGAVAQLSSTDLASFYTSAASAADTSAFCTASDFADGNVIVANQADGYSGDANVPVLFQFGSDAVDSEDVLANLTTVSELQTFGASVFQGFVDANDVDTIFDTTFKLENSLDSADIVSNGVKLAASVHGLQSGAYTLAVVDEAVTVIAELTEAATAPDLQTVVNHVNGLGGYSIPSCLGIVNASLADLATAAGDAEVTTVGTRASYTLPVSAFDFTVTPELTDEERLTHSVVYFMALLANEPTVLFVEPTVQPTTRASCQLDPVTSFPLGDAKEVAQGFGVSGSCQYLHDRGVDGAGEVIAIIDDGLAVGSTFFFAPDQEVFCANVAANGGDECCPLSGNSADVAANCVPGGSNTANARDLSADAQAALNLTVVVSSDGTRKVGAYIPFADGKSGAHGTAVASVILGTSLESVNSQFNCPAEFADAEDIVGVAGGAKAVFIDVGLLDGATSTVQIPYGNFKSMLTDLAYSTAIEGSTANVVTLAWGANTDGAADAVTRDIDSFLTENSDAIVVAAAGLKDEPNGNTALAKNGISVGVYSQATSATLLPTFSVQLSTAVDAASNTNDESSNFCGYEDFTGSSAAAAVVAGQTALVEHYLKEFGTVFHYDAVGNQTDTGGATIYSGATVKALLVAGANANCFGGEGSGNGFGVPVLDRVLPFDEEHQFDLRVEQHTLAAVGSRTREVTVTDTSRPLIVSLVYTDVAPTPFAAAGHGVVNDIRVTVRSPATEAAPNGIVLTSIGADGIEIDGTTGPANAQRVVVASPVEGTYTITVEAAFLSAAAAVDQTASLVVTGRFSVAAEAEVTGQEAGEITSVPACCPWGTMLPTTSCFPISFLVLIIIGVLALMLGVICLIAAKCKVKDVEGDH